MKLVRLILVPLAAAGLHPATALPAGAYGWLPDLAGHCWGATYPDGTRDRQCYSIQYDRFLRGSIEIVAPAAQRPTYLGDSLFVWDAERSEITVQFWSSTGTVGTMRGTLEADRILFQAGDEASTRTAWTRAGPDGFRVVQQRRQGSEWSDALALDYRRIAPANVSADPP